MYKPCPNFTGENSCEELEKKEIILIKLTFQKHVYTRLGVRGEFGENME